MTETTVRRALDELIDLAVAVREDWMRTDVQAAALAAANVGVTWEQALVGLVRLMVDPEAEPRDLVPDPRSPLSRSVPASSETRDSLVAQLRDSDWYRRAHPTGGPDDAA